MFIIHHWKGQTNMLRITPVEKDPGDLLLVVEGRVLGPWVAELETVAAQAMDSVPGRVFIDIEAVSFVDASGVKLLHRLLDQGVGLQAASPFILELLHLKS
jgi:anti-anti-sigma regulatory factor